MPEEVSSSPSPGGRATREVVNGRPPVAGSVAAAPTPKTLLKEEDRKKWFIEMRGWIMVLAVQVAAFTYQAGLNPPGGFCEDSSNGNGKCKDEEVPNPMKPVLESTDDFRYLVFFYSNTTAFVTSVAIIILLMNRTFYKSLAKVIVLEIIVVLDMKGLMAAYWAGSTRKDQTDAFALLITALVLFVIYVVFAVQLVHRFPAVWRLVRVARRDRDGSGGAGAVPVPEKDMDGAQAPPVLDIGRSTSEMRRRDSRPAARVAQTGQSSATLSPAIKKTMLSP